MTFPPSHAGWVAHQRQPAPGLGPLGGPSGSLWVAMTDYPRYERLSAAMGEHYASAFQYLAPGFCEAQPELREDVGGVREILCHGEPDASGVELVIYVDGDVDVSSRKSFDQLVAFHRRITADLGPNMPVPILETAVDVDAYFAVLMASDVPWPQLALQFVRDGATAARRASLALPESPRPTVVRAVGELDEPFRPPSPPRLRPRDWQRLVLRRAPSGEAYVLRLYAPVALFAFAYASFLTSLGALRPADWENGACSLAIVTAPFVVTIALALGSFFADEAQEAERE